MIEGFSGCDEERKGEEAKGVERHVLQTTDGQEGL